MRRAGQLVSERRLAEAEVEILEALVAVPDDVRAHKLLALVRFRLGRLVDARESYRRVVESAPDDAPSRMNLGLIALKLERFGEAVEELTVAARLRPDDARTLAYLGHAQARLGHPSEAARAFRQAGQPDLAAEVETRASALDSPFDTEEPHPTDDPEAGQPLTGFVHARLIDASAAAGVPGPGGYRLVIGQDGVDRPVQAYVREESLLAAVGAVAVEPARRRQRGQETPSPLAGPAGTFLACRGQGELWLTAAAPAGALDTLDLEEDVLFVRESSVLAFSGELVWESGAIPRSQVRLLHLSGSGRLVVDWSGRDVVALRLSEGVPLTVPAGRLCAWIGHVVVGLAGAGLPGPMVACQGEGVLLIARNGQAGERVHQRAEPGHDGPGHPDPRGAVFHR
jgi:hypothetical protein